MQGVDCEKVVKEHIKALNEVGEAASLMSSVKHVLISRAVLAVQRAQGESSMVSDMRSKHLRLVQDACSILIGKVGGCTL